MKLAEHYEDRYYQNAKLCLTLSNLSHTSYRHQSIADDSSSREAYVMHTKNGTTAFNWLQSNREELVVTFAPKNIQQWTAAADGLRMWMSREVTPRQIGFVTLHPPGLLTDDMEATLDLIQGGAAWNPSLEDLIAERVVYMQLVGAITESQNTPRNGTHIVILHILDTGKIKNQPALTRRDTGPRV